MKIFNILTGISYEIVIDKKVQQIEVLFLLSRVTGFKLKNRVFIYDIET